MKFLKLSKTSWLILAAGLFIVILAGLGITRSKQIQEQSQLEEDLSTSQRDLDKLKVGDLPQQLDELKQQVEEENLRLSETISRLHQTVVSVNATDEFFSIAEYCGVVVMSIGMTPIHSSKIKNIGLATTEIDALVKGELDNIINFVISLNNDFTTGIMKSFMLLLPASGSDEIPSVDVQMIIYSYEGAK